MQIHLEIKLKDRMFIVFGIFLNILRNNKQRELDETTWESLLEPGSRLGMILTPFVTVWTWPYRYILMVKLSSEGPLGV